MIFPFGKVVFVGMQIIEAKDISESIRQRRKQLGLTQAECASFCNVGARFFSELENGKETLQIGKVLHVLQMLGLEVLVVEKENNR